MVIYNQVNLSEIKRREVASEFLRVDHALDSEEWLDIALKSKVAQTQLKGLVQIHERGVAVRRLVHKGACRMVT